MKTPKEKLMILKIRKNIEKINKSSLDYLKNQELRIFKREKEIEYLDSKFKPAPIDIISNQVIKSSLNNQFYHTRDTFYKTTNSKFSFPRLKTNPNTSTLNTLNTYDRMKKYKVILKKKKGILPEEKIQRFIRQSGFTYIPKKKLEEKKLNENNIILDGDNNNIDKNNNDINDKEKNNNKNDKIKDNNTSNKNIIKNKNNAKLNIKIDMNNNYIEDKIN